MKENKPLQNKPCENLIMDQTNKQNYLLHFRDKKFYKKHGMKVTKVHTVYHFRQSPRLAKYIKYNADRRAKAKTKVETFF